jgi:D-3-phosphoglycerate dehydrogenase
MGAGASFAAAMAAQHQPPSAARSLKPFATADIKVLLLENVNATGQDLLRAQGYQVEALSTSLAEDELVERIKSVPSPPHIYIR